ncbi:MAG: alanyl-tRNA editing protein [Planctomycetota bacterium]
MLLAACQVDAYLRSLRTEVVSCEPAHDGGFNVRLTDTILYPEGGGQPADQGTIGGVPVLDVQRDAAETIIHKVGSPVGPGAVEVVLDWQRRYDHMQQHTAQHLLTALAQRDLDRTTTAFRLGATDSTIDLAGRPLSETDRERLEDLANEKVRAGLAVATRVVPRADMARLGVRSRLLPDGSTGPVRLVEVEGVDLNTCGGTHVASTREIQMIHLVATEKYKGGTRLYFLAGGRVLGNLRRTRSQERHLNDLLRCGPDQYAEAIERLQQETRETARTINTLKREVAGFAGAELAGSAATAAHAHRDGADLDMLRAMANAALEKRPDIRLLLTGTDSRGDNVFLVAGPNEVVAAAGPEIASLLSGRGGGGSGFFQGKAGSLERAAEAMSLLEKR